MEQAKGIDDIICAAVGIAPTFSGVPTSDTIDGDAACKGESTDGIEMCAV